MTMGSGRCVGFTADTYDDTNRHKGCIMTVWYKIVTTGSSPAMTEQGPARVSFFMPDDIIGELPTSGGRRGVAARSLKHRSRAVGTVETYRWL
jgi:hypothetical protein